MYSFSENNGGILSIKEIQPRCKLVRYKSHPHRLIYRDYVGYCIDKVNIAMADEEVTKRLVVQKLDSTVLITS
jgi:hypothetical protein